MDVDRPIPSRVVSSNRRRSHASPPPMNRSNTCARAERWNTIAAAIAQISYAPEVAGSCTIATASRIAAYCLRDFLLFSRFRWSRVYLPHCLSSVSTIRQASIVTNITASCGFRTVRVGKRNSARNAGESSRGFGVDRAAAKGERPHPRNGRGDCN